MGTHCKAVSSWQPSARTKISYTLVFAYRESEREGSVRVAELLFQPTSIMDFTEIYKQSGSLVSFSPGGHFILTAVQDRIVIRRTDSCQIARTVLLDATPSPTTAFLQKNVPETRISHAAWSSDSEYFLAACARKGFARVYKLHDETWNARIDAGVEGNDFGKVASPRSN